MEAATIDTTRRLEVNEGYVLDPPPLLHNVVAQVLIGFAATIVGSGFGNGKGWIFSDFADFCVEFNYDLLNSIALYFYFS